MRTARSIAAELDVASPVAVLCSDRFMHAVTTTSALAAGMSVLPLEPETPAWLLEPMMRAAGKRAVTILTDLHGAAAHRRFHSMRLLDATSCFDGPDEGKGTVRPQHGSLLTVFEGERGRYHRTRVSAPRLWCAARVMGARLGLTEQWLTASVTSLGAPGTFVNDVLAALASGAAAMILPRILVADPVRSLSMMLDHGVHSFSAPEFVLRHLLACVRAPRRGSLRYAVCTSLLGFGPQHFPDYERAMGHQLLAGQTSWRSPLWNALASAEHPHVLRGGPGSRDPHGEVARPRARLWVAAGATHEWERLDRLLLQVPEVVDSYTLSVSMPDASQPKLASLVVLDRPLHDRHLRQAIHGLISDPTHSFVRVSEVPRLADGRPLADDARALVGQHGEAF